MSAVMFAVVASLFWGVGQAMQKHGMGDSFPKISLGRFFREIGPVLKGLILHPVWAIGMVAMVGGMVCYAYALSRGDISLVQPMVNLTMVVAALIGVIFLHEKVSPIEWAGISVMLIGVFFIASGGGEATSVHPTTTALIVMSVVFTLLVVAVLLVEKIGLRLRIEVTLSLATGLSFGLANIMGKVMTQRVIAQVGVFSLTDPDCLLAILADFPLYLVILANIFGFIFYQTAFANGRVSLTSPIITIFANTSPVIAAIPAFHEQIGVGRALGILLAVVGTAMLMGRKETEEEANEA